MRAGIFAGLLLFSGCVSLPQKTIELNETVTEGIEEGRDSHLELGDEYLAQRYARIDEWVRHVWAPDHVQNALADAKFATIICNEPGKRDKAFAFLELAIGIIKRMAAVTAREKSKVRKVVRKMMRGVRSHWSEVESSNRMVTTTLQTVSERLDMEKAVRDFGLKQADKLMPASEVSGKLDGLFKKGE